MAGCLGDQQAAVLGQRCGPGTAKSTYGTGCFVLLHTGPRRVASAHGLLTTVAHRLGADAEPQYALEVGAALSLCQFLQGIGPVGLLHPLEPLSPCHCENCPRRHVTMSSNACYLAGWCWALSHAA